MATIINIMADGTICRTQEELLAYMEGKTLPEDAARLIVGFVRKGEKLLREEGDHKAAAAQQQE